jgi:uncharacterized protein (TIGR02996 family)
VTIDRDLLRRGILLDPFSDVPRLVYADWEREFGDEGIADFIQVQCGNRERYVDFGQKWLNGGSWTWTSTGSKMPRVKWKRAATRLASEVRDSVTFWAKPRIYCRLLRGMVEELSCHQDDFFSRPCRLCDQRQREVGYQSTQTTWDNCPECSGTGRFLGLAVKLFGKLPIVTVKFRDVALGRRTSGAAVAYSSEEADFPGTLNPLLFSRLTTKYRKGAEAYFLNEAEGIRRVSETTVDYARSLHGLPALFTNSTQTATASAASSLSFSA